MTRTMRSTLMAGAAAVTALSLALGSVVAQDDVDDADAMDTMQEMAPGITIRDAWTRESMMVDLAGAAYMVINNGSDDEDTLIGASSPAAGTVEIHETSMDAEGAMVMQPVGEIALAPHADTVLEPGGYHIMLIDLAEPLVEGVEIELSLEFATAEPQTIMLPVTGPMGMDMGSDGDMDMDGEAEMEDMEMEDED